MDNQPKINSQRNPESDAAFEAAFEQYDLFDSNFSETENRTDFSIPDSAQFNAKPDSEYPVKLTLDLGDGDWQSFCLAAAATDRDQAIGRIFDAINILDLFEGITEVCGKDATNKLKHLKFELIPEKHGAYAAFAADLKDIEFKIVDGTYQHVFKTMKFFGESQIVLPILSAASCSPEAISSLRATVAEEILHILMSGTPQNEFIDEGLAGTAINLMIKRGYLDSGRYQTGVELISGFEDNSGLNAGDLKVAHNNSVHNLIHAAGTTAISESLGSSESEIADNFKILFSVCHDFSKGVSYTDWINKADQYICGFKDRLDSHKLNRPLTSGKKIAFVRCGITGQIARDNGDLYVFEYQKNPNYGLTKFRIPNNIMPTIHHFDLEPGHAAPLNYAIIIKAQNGHTVELESGRQRSTCRAVLSSDELGEIFSRGSDDNKIIPNFSRQKVHISVSIDENNWHRVGKNFYLPALLKNHNSH